jgi:hypothetical protein
MSKNMAKPVKLPDPYKIMNNGIMIALLYTRIEMWKDATKFVAERSKTSAPWLEEEMIKESKRMEAELELLKNQM